MLSDETHKSIRKNRPPAFADFMDEVYLNMPVDVKSSLPKGIGEYVNSIVVYALNRLEKFGNSLAKAIYGVYFQSPGGERFILDPTRTYLVQEAMLFLDQEGNIIAVINPKLERINEDKTGKSILVFADYQSYEILTGKQAGSKFDKYSRPIATELKNEITPLTSKTTVEPSKVDSNKRIQIFLCHASEDKEHVRNLYQKLKNSGFDPWLDEEELLPGQDWNLEIQKALKKSDIILVCLSTRSEKKGYVQKEIVKALDIVEEFPEGEIFIIPVKLEECPVPLRLSKWQWVDLWNEAGFEKLTKSLKKVKQSY